MNMELNKSELADLLNRQLYNFFGSCDNILIYIDQSLQRAECCFEKTRNKYYHDISGRVFFSPFHSGQYSIFLYYLSNTIYQNGNISLANRVYYLNKVMNSVDWYYEIELPEYWGVEHPLGSVLGRAKYGNGLFIYQGCTVGGSRGNYPTIGDNVILYSNSSILGKSIIGNNVIMASGTIVKDEIIPDNCLVFGQSPNLVIKQKDIEYINELIYHFWLF